MTDDRLLQARSVARRSRGDVPAPRAYAHRCSRRPAAPAARPPRSRSASAGSRSCPHDRDTRRPDLGCRGLRQRARAVLDEVERAVVGKRQPLTLVLSAVLAKGHVLLEDFPGLGKTLAARSLRPGARPGVRARPVHPRPPAGRHHRLVPLQPEGRQLRVPSRAAVHRAAARRRDQPDAAEDPVGPAGGDAGAAGDRRGRDLPAARPLPRARDGEPDRVRRHLSRCPRRSSTGS